MILRSTSTGRHCSRTLLLLATAGSITVAGCAQGPRQLFSYFRDRGRSLAESVAQKPNSRPFTQTAKPASPSNGAFGTESTDGHRPPGAVFSALVLKRPETEASPQDPFLNTVESEQIAQAKGAASETSQLDRYLLSGSQATAEQSTDVAESGDFAEEANSSAEDQQSLATAAEASQGDGLFLSDTLNAELSSRKWQARTLGASEPAGPELTQAASAAAAAGVAGFKPPAAARNRSIPAEQIATETDGLDDDAPVGSDITTARVSLNHFVPEARTAVQNASTSQVAIPSFGMNRVADFAASGMVVDSDSLSETLNRSIISPANATAAQGNDHENNGPVLAFGQHLANAAGLSQTSLNVVQANIADSATAGIVGRAIANGAAEIPSGETTSAVAVPNAQAAILHVEPRPNLAGQRKVTVKTSSAAPGLPLSASSGGLRPPLAFNSRPSTLDLRPRRQPAVVKSLGSVDWNDEQDAVVTATQRPAMTKMLVPGIVIAAVCLLALALSWKRWKRLGRVDA